MEKRVLQEKTIEVINNLFNLKITENDINKTLFSLGIDSINFMIIIVHLEEEFHKDIDIDYTLTDDFFNLILSDFIDAVWEFVKKE